MERGHRGKHIMKERRLMLAWQERCYNNTCGAFEYTTFKHTTISINFWRFLLSELPENYRYLSRIESLYLEMETRLSDVGRGAIDCPCGRIEKEPPCPGSSTIKIDTPSKRRDRGYYLTQQSQLGLLCSKLKDDPFPRFR